MTAATKTAKQNRAASEAHDRKAQNLILREREAMSAQAAERTQSPKFQAERLAHQAGQAEELAATYTRIHHPGAKPAWLAQQRQHYASEAAQLYQRAHELDPGGGFKARAERVRSKGGRA